MFAALDQYKSEEFFQEHPVIQYSTLHGEEQYQIIAAFAIPVYTGYDFETDIKEKMMVKWPETREIIRYIDILVDGEFIEDKKDLTLRFRGSSNQRIIDVPESLNKGEVVLWNQEGRITQ